MSTLKNDSGRFENRANKTSGLVRHFFYMIAIGEWRAGTRLPSIRQLEKSMSVNRLTILKAFRILTEFGMLVHKPNSGYYVSGPENGSDYSIDRIELNNLYDKICSVIMDETDLLPLISLRLLAEIAERRMSENPVIIFVECSKSQAEDHAKQITESLQIPIMPVSIDEIDGNPNRISPSVRIIMTTPFHSKELSYLNNAKRKVVSIPVQISEKLISDIKNCSKNIIILEPTKELADRAFNDASLMMGIGNPQVEVVRFIERYLHEQLENNKYLQDTLYLVSQKQWDKLSGELKATAFVQPITCELNETAWPIILATLNIPFGMSRR